MQKPNRPIKPLKHAAPPSEFDTISLVAMFKYETKELVLKPEEYLEDYNGIEGMPQYEYDNLDKYNGQTLKYSDILKIKNLLPPDIEDFTVGTEINEDGDYDYTIIRYKIKKNQEQYQNQLKNFNNRFEKYEKELAAYRAKMRVYNEWAKEQRIEKLKKELQEAQKI